MKAGDRFRYVGHSFGYWRCTGRIVADGSRGGDGPPCWDVLFDDGRDPVLSPDEVAPESAVDALGSLAAHVPQSAVDALADLERE